jgi:(E)-4-hydroxy-3-methylbut-2-enyl-diphosphate synthase
MVQAYRELVKMMQDSGNVFPLHLGVTEAGNGDSGRIKSCVGIASLMRQGIGDTIRVSLTEPPVNEIPVAKHIVNYFSSGADKTPDPVLDAALEWGPKLLDREIDSIPADAGISTYLEDEIMQAARRRFYKPEYIACPGCGRTMYRLEDTFEEVKKRTSHLKGMVIAVMGCIVNGPGEMADADWGYVGEGGGRVSIYHKGEPVLRHIPDKDAIDKLLELIEADQRANA